MDRTEVRGYIEISGTNGVEVKNFEGRSGTNCIVAEAVDSDHRQTIRFSELYRFVGDPSTCIPWVYHKNEYQHASLGSPALLLARKKGVSWRLMLGMTRRGFRYAPRPPEMGARLVQ